MRNSVIIVGLIAAVAGFADAFYLTLEHYLNKIPPCSVGGCETVLTSQYSTIAGIPVALLGVVFFVAMALIAVSYLVDCRPVLLRLFGYGSVIGFVASVWFVSAQLFLLHAICLYCITAESLETVLFVCGIVLLRHFSSERQSL